MNRKYLVIVAATAAVLSFSARASEVDSVQYLTKIQSTRSAAEVRAEARNPLPVSEISVGTVGMNRSTTSVEQVKALGILAARRGETSKGEIGLM